MHLLRFNVRSRFLIFSMTHLAMCWGSFYVRVVVQTDIFVLRSWDIIDWDNGYVCCVRPISLECKGRVIDAATFSHGYVGSFFWRISVAVPWNYGENHRNMVVGTTFFLGTGLFSENYKECISYIHGRYILYSSYIFSMLLFLGCRNIPCFYCVVPIPRPRIWWGSGLLLCDSVAMPAAFFPSSLHLGSGICGSCCDLHGAATLRAMVVFFTATLVRTMARER